LNIIIFFVVVLFFSIYDFGLIVVNLELVVLGLDAVQAVELDINIFAVTPLFHMSS